VICEINIYVESMGYADPMEEVQEEQLQGQQSQAPQQTQQQV
jgi:hypothetical protein